MNALEQQSKKEKIKKSARIFILAFCIGTLQGALASSLGLLLKLINSYAVFGVLLIWLVFGWVSTYFIKLRILDIITIIVSSALSSGIIYYLSTLSWWFILLILGSSIFFWSISFITKLMLYPPDKKAQILNEIEANEKNET